MTLRLRQAVPDDAAHFVRMFSEASHGLADHLWRISAAEGEDPMERAARNLRKRLAEYEPRDALVAEIDGKVAGATRGYLIGAEPEPMPDDVDPNIKPLVLLENLALNTRYINAVAVWPAYQGSGAGTAMIKAALQSPGPAGTSLIVEDVNHRAATLYRRMGFVQTAEAAFEPVGWQTDCRAFQLMIHPG